MCEDGRVLPCLGPRTPIHPSHLSIGHTHTYVYTPTNNQSTKKDGATYGATASAHPSFLTVEDAALVNAPILLLPSKDEADLVRAVFFLPLHLFVCLGFDHRTAVEGMGG